MVKILVVDDKPDNLVVVKAICRKHMPEIEVIAAGSGREGIDLTKSEQPDTVLLDIIMPGLDGFEVCQILKSDPQTSHIPIILLTAIMTDSKARVKGLELGADAFVNKPINEDELIAQIKVMLRIKTAEDLLRQEKELVEDQLQGSETRYRDLFSNMAEGFALCEIILDQKGKPYDYRHLTVNDAYTKQTGIPTQAVLGKTVRELFPDVEDVWIENYGEVALTGKAKSFVSYNHNTDKYFDVRSFSPSKGIFALLVQDITQAHLDSVELRRSDEFNKSITRTAPYAIISTDDEGQVLSWNKAAEALFGFEEKEMLGKTLESIVPVQYLKSHIAGLKRLKDGGAPKLLGKTVEISALRKRKEEFPIELGISSWSNDDKRFYTAIIRDISDRKRIESELQKAVEVAEHANEVKDQFIANISHEIRTPLNSLLGFTDLVKQKYGSKVEDLDRQIFGYISNSSNRLLATVDAILNISQLSTGSIVVHPKKNDLCTLARLVVEDLRPMAVNKGLEVQMDIPKEALISLIDDQSVYQALHNVVENSLKFTREGEVGIHLKQKDGFVELSVRDTGVGISEEYQKRMFQPYTQESEGFTKDYQGIGLGLALAKRFLELNDVAIEVESEKGVGTTFKLIFKVYEEHNND